MSEKLRKSLLSRVKWRAGEKQPPAGERSIRRDHPQAISTLAMQKVEGSSPFSRSERKPRKSRGFLFLVVSADAYASSYNNYVRQMTLWRVCRGYSQQKSRRMWSARDASERNDDVPQSRSGFSGCEGRVQSRTPGFRSPFTAEGLERVSDQFDEVMRGLLTYARRPLTGEGVARVVRWTLLPQRRRPWKFRTHSLAGSLM
jgi:hypothetical protein